MKNRVRVWKSIVSGVAAAVMMSQCVFAAESTDNKEVKVITYDYAVQLAIDNNSTLEELADTIDLLEYTQEKVVQTMTMSPTSPNEGVLFADSATLMSLSAYQQASGGQVSAAQGKIMAEAGSELAVLNYFTSIKKDQSTLELTKKNYEIAKKNLENATIKADLGMISKKDYEDLKNAVVQAKKNVESLEVALETDYINLGKLLGLKADEKFEIKYNADFEPIEKINDLDSYITRKLSYDPYLKSKATSVDTAEFSMKVFTYDGTQPAKYRTNENTLKSAQRSYKDDKETLQVKMKEAYNQLLQLEANHESLTAALETAKAQYDTAKINYDIGNITELQLNQAELAVIQAENSLKDNIYSNELLKVRFENQFLLMPTA